jgi:hypothetical protein
MSIQVKDANGTTKYFSTAGVGDVTTPFLSIPASFLSEVAKGNVPGHSIVQKFGNNSLVGTTYVPISTGGIYRTPQVGSATTLRVKAGGNANDTLAGSGARKVLLQGLDETGALVTEEISLAGASASSATTTTFIRLFRAYVTESGTYATQAAGSHAGNIVIENGAGGTDWGTIELNGFALSQTRTGAYSVPLGKTAYLLSAQIQIESTKTVDIIFFQRQGILKTAAPYNAMRMVFEAGGLIDSFNKGGQSSWGPFPELTDIGFLAKISVGTANLSVDFEILLVDN